MLKRVFLTLIILLICCKSYADSKLTALTALTAPAGDDLLYIVDDPSGSPTSKKITWDNLGRISLDVISTDLGSNIVKTTIISNDLSVALPKIDILSSDVNALMLTRDIISNDVAELKLSADIISRDLGLVILQSGITSTDVIALQLSRDIISNDIASIKLSNDIISRDLGIVIATSGIISNDVGNLKIHSMTFPINDPDNLEVTNGMPLWTNTLGRTLNIIKISADSDTDDTYCYLSLASQHNYTNSEDIAQIYITENGTGVYYDNVPSARIVRTALTPDSSVLFSYLSGDSGYIKITITLQEA